MIPHRPPSVLSVTLFSRVFLLCAVLTACSKGAHETDTKLASGSESDSTACGADSVALVSTPQTSAWHWRDRNGRVHNRAALDSVLARHYQWLESEGKLGRRADLAGAYLYGANLVRARLKGANLRGAILSRARLDAADLSGADLGLSNLEQAVMYGANLPSAQLPRATVRSADLRSAFLELANLSQADLRHANLCGATLANATLGGALLWGADLRDANLIFARLRGPVDPPGEAGIVRQDPSVAQFFQARVDGMDFEPADVPDVRSMASVSGLGRITYNRNPDALIQLKNGFRDGGFRRQERDLAYVLMNEQTRRITESRERQSLSWLGSLGSYFNVGIRLIFLKAPIDYGRALTRPLYLIAALWLVGSFLYYLLAHRPASPTLFVVEKRGEKEVRTPVWVFISSKTGKWKSRLMRELKLLAYTSLFSLMTTFNCGFKELDFGRWIRNALPADLNLQATGAIRSVAGVQALASLYLLALWVLNYFGRPFDNFF